MVRLCGTKSPNIIVVMMKFVSVAAALLPMASGAMFAKQEYESGQVMSAMMEAKEVCMFVLFLWLLGC
jgi:hypothetical protein